jgi:hypothetical protein
VGNFLKLNHKFYFFLLSQQSHLKNNLSAFQVTSKTLLLL